MTAQQQLSRQTFDTPAAMPGCNTCPLASLEMCGGGTRNEASVSRAQNVGQNAGFALARRVFSRQDEVRDLVPVICSGWAAAYVNLPNGNRQILSFVLPGEFLSASLIFSGAQYVWVEAISDVNYRTFNRIDFMREISGRPQAFALIAEVWIKEKRRADRLIVDLGRRTAEERIASLLIDLMDRLQARDLLSPDGSMEFPLRQHHIADATGLTSVHVSKVLSEFRRRGLFTLSERVLTIKDAVALRRSAGEPHSR